MSEERPPEDLAITIEDFRQAKWQKVIASADEISYSSYCDSFSNAARIAVQDGNDKMSAVLWLFADACSMQLKPEYFNNPLLQPFIVKNGRRSKIEDFSGTDVAFFESIISEIDDFRLKARIADILWLSKTTRDVKYADCAIDNYRKFPLDMDGLLSDGLEAWERAIRLILQIHKSDDKRTNKMRDAIFQNFQQTDLKQKFHAQWLAKLLVLFGLDEGRNKEIAAKLESFAVQAKSESNYHLAKGYFQSAIEWNKEQKIEPDSYRLTVALAETWVSEAEQRASGDNPSNIAAGLFLDKAIQILRSIPNKERATFKVDTRIQKLHNKMTTANKLALGEMRPIYVPFPDLGELIEASQNHVKSRSFPDVLLAFVGIHSGMNEENIRESSKKIMQQSILTHLSTSRIITEDGRVAASSPSINTNNIENPATQQALFSEMIRNYGMQVALIVQAKILPALGVLNLEHRVTEGTLLSICGNSGVVPSGREVLWAKGLYFGFEGDFIISTHLLIPQLEHLVRIAMKGKGIKTSTLKDGIETENGLSTLLEHKDIGNAIDENLTFELRALLTEKTGPNLRNDAAHGLLEASEAMSAYTIYLWWLCLRLVVITVPWKIVEPVNEDTTKSQSVK